MHSKEKRSVIRTIDMRLTVRLGLSLLLLAAAVGPVCLVMSPSMAMATEAPAEECNIPTPPSTECPELSDASDAKSAGVSTADISVALEPMQVAPALTSGSCAHRVVAPDPQRPVAQLTPLRL